jgi:hypothetical protein
MIYYYYIPTIEDVLDYQRGANISEVFSISMRNLLVERANFYNLFEDKTYGMTGAEKLENTSQYFGLVADYKNFYNNLPKRYLNRDVADITFMEKKHPFEIFERVSSTMINYHVPKTRTILICKEGPLWPGDHNCLIMSRENRERMDDRYIFRPTDSNN